MDTNYFEIYTLLVLSLWSFLLGSWTSIYYITNREASLLLVFFAVVATNLVLQHRAQRTILNFLHRNVTAVQAVTLLEVEEVNRKRILALKTAHTRALGELQDENHRLAVRFDHACSENDWMTSLYRDLKRLNEEQLDRIAYLEKKLKESGHLAAGGVSPYSAPASQIVFGNPPRRAGAAAGPSSPLAQAPMVQDSQGEGE